MLNPRTSQPFKPLGFPALLAILGLPSPSNSSQPFCLILGLPSPSFKTLDFPAFSKIGPPSLLHASFFRLFCSTQVQRIDLKIFKVRPVRHKAKAGTHENKPKQRRKIIKAFRTYRAICKAWGIPAFPMSLETIRCFGASMKAGHYRSVALYYQAAIGFQARHLETPIEPFLRGAIKDAIRSVRRGLGPSSLKESFDPMELLTIPITDTVEPFDAQKVHHMLDVTIIALWFMMREIEIAASKLQHLTLDDQSVHLTIPSSKTDTIGQWTSRTLRCACRYQTKSLCPWHAAYRHLRRVRVHPTFRNSQDFPLVPNIDGTIMTKPQIISSLRGLLEAAGIPVTRQDESGNSLPRFGGHAFRVSGAQMLGAGGVPLQLIQLLGRWTSMAIQRYVQQSHLAVVPSVPEQLLNNRPSQLISHVR